MARKRKRAEPLTIEQAQAIAAEVARGFDNLECAECVAAIAKELGRGFEASFERLRTADGSDLILLVETGIPVSTNKVHIGIRIGDVIIDNIHPSGVQANVWISRYVALTNAVLIRETSSIQEFFTKVFQRKRFSRWLSRPVQGDKS